ncbi:MAG: gamma-glutamyltransferase [marine benthic group bacterium]|nr:gamma-glutamyltransferase [Gemmatimonadota bacterium]MCL7989719.1 gamma-glutamyltransferase [Gemmatimonadota bacterium]
MSNIMSRIGLVLVAAATLGPADLLAQRTTKPVLHGRNWVAITGKPLGATAGALVFAQGGNAVDAACAMLAATSTMWDVLSWGGETQALIFDPRRGEVVGINAVGVAPTGATADFYRDRELEYPPMYGPLAAVTPGTPGGLMVMLAEFGTLSLAEVLAPAIEMADGYPIEGQAVRAIERHRERLESWSYSRSVFFVEEGDSLRAPRPGEIFRQPDLATTLRALVEAEREALEAGADRAAAIRAAYDRFYRGDIAAEIVRGTREEGGLITMEDLDRWQVRIEEPVQTDYRGIDVYKLTTWTQGPAMLQALNILENFDLGSLGFNSAAYIHTIVQAMQLAFADRDFYYGDPYSPPEEPVEGLLSKEYAAERAALVNPDHNDPDARPGDPYRYQEGENPFSDLLGRWHTVPERSDEGNEGGIPGPSGISRAPALGGSVTTALQRPHDDPSASRHHLGTTSIQAADAEGWVVSVTPSGGWIPATVAGRTGVGLSQRAQSFVTDPADNPYNVIEPGKRPRVTLTPGMALKDGAPFLSFAVQGGDTQDQNLLQFLLNVVEFGMDVQQAVEAPNVNTYQLRSSFGEHASRPGRLVVHADTPPWVRAELREMGYDVVTAERTSGPINAIWFDREHGTMWGGSSDYGEDYGLAW